MLRDNSWCCRLHFLYCLALRLSVSTSLSTSLSVCSFVSLSVCLSVWPLYYLYIFSRRRLHVYFCSLLLLLFFSLNKFSRLHFSLFLSLYFSSLLIDQNATSSKKSVAIHARLSTLSVYIFWAAKSDHVRTNKINYRRRRWRRRRRRRRPATKWVLYSRLVFLGTVLLTFHLGSCIAHSIVAIVGFCHFVQIVILFYSMFRSSYIASINSTVVISFIFFFALSFLF